MCRLAGTDNSDAMNGNAGESPNWKFDAPSPFMNCVTGDPLIIVCQMEPNTHPSVMIPNRLRNVPSRAAAAALIGSVSWSSEGESTSDDFEARAGIGCALSPE